MFDTNVRGAMFGMKHAAPIMIAQRAGSIITIVSGLVPFGKYGWEASVEFRAEITRRVRGQNG